MPKYLLSLQDPTIRTYLDYAFLFGIRNGNTNFENYLFSNYANLSFVNTFYDEIWDPFDFFPAPRLRQAIQTGILHAQGHDLWRRDVFSNAVLIDFIEQNLREQRYLYVVLDEYHIRGKGSYKSAHFIHHSLVVGMDRDRRTIAIISYFKNIDYGLQWIPLKDFLPAFDFDCRRLQGTLQERFYVWNHRYIETLSISNDARNELEYDRLLTELKDYLNASCSPELLCFHNKPLDLSKVSFGLAVYDRLAELLDMMEAGRIDTGFHPTRLFFEHKAFMFERIQYLEKRSVPIKKASFGHLDNLVQLAKEIRFYMIAASKCSAKESFDAVRQRLRHCREIEQRCYPELIKSLLVYA